MSRLFDLNGKSALITGSSRGIGQAIAEALADHGANVVISSRRQDSCDAAAQAINQRGGGRAIAMQASATRQPPHPSGPSLLALAINAAIRRSLPRSR